MKKIIVQKFGGTSVADTDKIKKIYDELIQHVKDDDKEEFYKKAAEMAISMGISRQQWEEDRKRMEKMENLILEE